MDFWSDVLSSWENFLTFIIVVGLFYGVAWALVRVVDALSKSSRRLTAHSSYRAPHPRTPSDPFVTNVAGVTFEGRQDVIRRLTKGQMLELVPEPDNPHDPNAVMVLTRNGEQLGYLNRELAKTESWMFKASMFSRPAKVVDVIGDEGKGQSLGLVIEVYPPTLEEALVSSDMRYPMLGGFLAAPVPPASVVMPTESIPEPVPIPSPSAIPAAPREESVPPARSAPIRVLIVDDFRQTRELLREVIEASGSMVVVGEAADGMEAVTLFETTWPDVVVMDSNMPRLDGIEATRVIRQRHPDARIMIDSTFMDGTDLRRAIASGAAETWDKPING